LEDSTGPSTTTFKRSAMVKQKNNDPIASLAEQLGCTYTVLASPNCEARVDKQTGQPVKKPHVLVLHYTACEKQATINTFMAPRGASAHYIVDRRGGITRFVPEEQRAWHAGYGAWQGNHDINTASVGIENISLGFKHADKHPTGQLVPGSNKAWYRYDEALLTTLGPLCKNIVERYRIHPTCVIAHSDLATNPTTGYLGRKSDPGPLFPWERFYREYGVGAWYDLGQPLRKVALPTRGQETQWIRKHLVQYGYPSPKQKAWDQEATKHAVRVFQMHFRQQDISGKIDEETIQILARLVERYYTKA